MLLEACTAAVIAVTAHSPFGELSAGALAARSLDGIGHVAGIVGVAASAVVVAGLLAARHGPGMMRALAQRKAACRRTRPLP
jgi:hypothetical protein